LSGNHVTSRRERPGVIRRSCADFFVQSQLVIVHLRRLEQTADFHGARTLLLLGFSGRFLAVFGEEVRVVARELLQLDQEVA